MERYLKRNYVKYVQIAMVSLIIIIFTSLLYDWVQSKPYFMMRMYSNEQYIDLKNLEVLPDLSNIESNNYIYR